MFLRVAVKEMFHHLIHGHMQLETSKYKLACARDLCVSWQIQVEKLKLRCSVEVLLPVYPLRLDKNPWAWRTAGKASATQWKAGKSQQVSLKSRDPLWATSWIKPERWAEVFKDYNNRYCWGAHQYMLKYSSTWCKEEQCKSVEKSASRSLSAYQQIWIETLQTVKQQQVLNHPFHKTGYFSETETQSETGVTW